MLAYQMIEIVDHLNLAAHRLIEPISRNTDYPEIVRRQADLLIQRADLLVDQTVDLPDLDRLYAGVTELRAEVERFMNSVLLK